ncbi:hypothetical protein DV737_g4066, partial [Chaetothyriales sp. CBS 132003]
MSKSKSKGAKPTKAADVLGKAKNAGVTKQTKTAKAQSKSIAQTVSKKSIEKTKSKGKKEKTTVNGTSKGAKPAANGAAKSDSESSSEDDSESKTKKPKANVAAKKQVASDSEDDSDESETDASSGDDSESEDEKTVISAVMGAEITQGDNDSEQSDSDEESASEDGVVAPKINGKVNASAESDDGSSDESNSSDEKNAPKTNGAPKTSTDNEDAAKTKPQIAKRKADEEEPDRAIKKAKAEEAANGSNLFVGNLSWNITEEWLQEEFEQFGEITGVRLMTDRATGRSKGFGYVEFANAADAAKAHDAKKGSELDGRPINVDFANAKPSDKQRVDNRSKSFGDQVSEPAETLFVGNLAFSVTAEKVSEAFEPHGGIQGIRLPTDQESGKPRGFGYITFNSVEEATAALEAMNGFYLEGRPLRLDYSGQRNKSGNNDSPRGGFGGRGRGRGGFGDAGGRGGFNSRGGRGGRGGRGAPRGGRGGTTNRGGFGDFSGKKTTF